MPIKVKLATFWIVICAHLTKTIDFFFFFVKLDSFPHIC